MTSTQRENHPNCRFNGMTNEFERIIQAGKANSLGRFLVARQRVLDNQGRPLSDNSNGESRNDPFIMDVAVSDSKDMTVQNMRRQANHLLDSGEADSQQVEIGHELRLRVSPNLLFCSFRHIRHFSRHVPLACLCRGMKKLAACLCTVCSSLLLWQGRTSRGY